MKIIPLAGMFLVLASCGQKNKAPVITDREAYVQEIRQWQENRLERLKSKNGWLNLAGLFWLKEGPNTFGSDSANQVVLPPKAPPFWGTITLDSSRLYLKVQEGVETWSEDSLVSALELFDDQSGRPTHLRNGDLSWFIIKRGDRFGIRLRDYGHPRIEALDHIPSYPIQPDYVVEARFIPFDEPHTVTVATPVPGYMEDYTASGTLHFALHGKNLALLPFNSGNGYFLIIADETTGVETYGSGRFMYAQPDSTGRIILDFNKAYNPPCAYSPFATCPMPPRQNFLPVAIRAGEKAVHLE